MPRKKGAPKKIPIKIDETAYAGLGEKIVEPDATDRRAAAGPAGEPSYPDFGKVEAPVTPVATASKVVGEVVGLVNRAFLDAHGLKIVYNPNLPGGHVLVKK